MTALVIVIFGLLLLLAMLGLARLVASSEAKAEATSALPYWVGWFWQ